jgi:hypothetical protein
MLRLLLVCWLGLAPLQSTPPPQIPVPPPQGAAGQTGQAGQEEDTCDDTGEIRCVAMQGDVVTVQRSLQDMRVIGTFVRLVSERNRRYYLAWQTKAPSAAFELVKRVKSFPYLPYGDTYGITGVEVVLNQAKDQLTVRYPKHPKPGTDPLPKDDYVVYSTKLSAFIDTLEKENVKLKKYEKLPAA